MAEPEESIAIGVVAHHVFCPRRAWLEVHGERTDTAQVAVGVRDHRAVDDQATSRGARMRTIDVSSQALGIHGRCDSVEVARDGRLTVVEHKAAPLRRRSVATEANRVQLALQALCLREAGRAVAGAAVWFSTTRKRVPVELTEDLLAGAAAAVGATRAVVSSVTPPPPLEDDDRCRLCSHVSVCLPDEHRQRLPARRISVADPLGTVLHLTTPGSRARVRRGRIEVSARGEEPASVPIGQVAGVVVHGNADVSSALLREMLARGFPIVWCSWSGRVVGWATPASGPNGDLRAAQHRLDPEVRLAVAQSIVAAKIKNQRHMLRRHRLAGREELLRAAELASSARSIGEVVGIEGGAAARYFSSIRGALRAEWATFGGRNARPAIDAVNAALNVAYGLLLADVIRAIAACGLDSHGGVMHTPGRNKPALALDLMEEFRPLVADSTVLWAINNGELRAGDARDDFGVVRLNERGRKALIATYERRVTGEFQHPRFGYRVSWRRAMEIQARMFLAVVAGSSPTYEPIVAR
ncbi:CRISPR-associated endonuclease Cas1 [Conexibacter arvalis]|uniref:CRISPR-associated endonuclease Cas1 n=1 Tax=Conexibacter arvalis TaxID=912552 RepID=A0A840IG31_9ACTN|nr:CRISPR-associated endonuclease Cas1 [Conexibacter arvalis]MBB4663295.1 CRISPR-associated protein Cas1 [Conexibacter arvalis]